MKPALLLIPHKSTSFENNRVGMCVSLSWSSFDGHKMIAGGYGDGKTLNKSYFFEFIYLLMKEIQLLMALLLI